MDSYFIFRGFSCNLNHVSEMKKSDFDKEFSKIWKPIELKQAWELLQKLVRDSKKSKEVKKGYSKGDK